MNKVGLSPTRQRGAASLIFVLLVALVVTASTNEAVKSIRNSQEIGTAVNATSHAQTGVWVAAEAMRAYLDTLDSGDIQLLGGPHTTDFDIEMDASYGSVTAEILNYTNIAPNNDQVEVLLVNKHAASRSSAKINVVYNVTYTNQPTVADPPVPTVQFAGGLTVTGGINLLNGGEPINLAVDGDVNIASISVNPINEIHSTGKVSITNSSVSVGSIYADDDVELDSTTVLTVRTLGTLETKGSASVADTIANGDVTIKSSGRFEQISTQKNIYVNSGGAGLGIIIAGEDIEASQSGPIDSANAVGDITFDNWFDVEYATAMGDITCVQTGWKRTLTLSANGSLNDCPAGGQTSALDSSVNITTISGASNTVVPSPELQPRTLPTTEIDVWKINDDVNYFVEYDNSVNKIKVTVNAVNDLDDGDVYYIGSYRNIHPNYTDYLCTVVDSGGNCTAPSTPLLPLCFGFSLYSSCISYNPGTQTFTIRPADTAPGIFFFDGNVKLDSGHGMSTILASGNISTHGGFKFWAPNRGAYDKICLGNADHARTKERYTDTYSKYYPTNLCDIDNGEYTPLNIGNVALAAGGINPDTTVNPDSDYTGGDINLGSSTDIWGAVLAGNFLETGGQTSIKGLVSAGAFGDPTSGDNKIGSNTSIELQATDDYDPLALPTVTVIPPPPPIIITNASIAWSRPL